MVPEPGSEEGEARELPVSPALLPGFSTALQVTRVLDPLFSRPLFWGFGRAGTRASRVVPVARMSAGKLCSGLGLPLPPGAPGSRETAREKQALEPGKGFGRRLGDLFLYYPQPRY